MSKNRLQLVSSRAGLPARRSLYSLQDALGIPMRFVGANADGSPVIGVAASATVVGTLELGMFRRRPGAALAFSIGRRLTPGQARLLARHLEAAADEAQRCERLLRIDGA